MSSAFARLLGAMLPPPEVVTLLALRELRAFNAGLDVGRHVFGPWDVRDPISDLKHDHAGAAAFRAVFA